ncbi:MAG: MFS transporter, partial [Dehalococcoidia bacterium]
LAELTMRVRYLDLLRNRDFALLLGGQTISRLGDGLQVAALLWFALQLGGTRAVTLTAFAASLPSLALGLFGGVYADRWDRRRAMIWSDIARGLAVLIIPLIAATATLTTWHLVLVAALLSIGGTLAEPARGALLPALIRRDQLLAANALSGATLQASYWLGPALLGLILQFAALKDVFTLDAITFGVAAATDVLIRYRGLAGPAPARGGIIGEIGDGIETVRGDLLLWVPVLVFTLSILFAAGVRIVALPVLVRQTLHQTAGSFGLILGAAGVGELIGNIVIGQFLIRAKGTATSLGWALLGSLRAPLGLIPDWRLGAGLLFGSGCVSALTDAPLIALLQERTAEAQLGRVMGLWRTLLYGADTLAAPLIGGLLVVLPITAVFLLCGLLTSAIGLLGAIVCWSRERPGCASHRLRRT